MYSNDTIYHPGHLFTFGTSRKGAYSRQGAYLSFWETTKCLKQNFNTNQNN